MLRSVKSQIIMATSVIILLLLGATAYFVIDQKVKEINYDIFNKALSFAELTHERVVANYELNYTQKAFANFQREMADVYALNSDITGTDIFNYQGENLYHGEALDPLVTLTDKDLERIQAVMPSVKVKKNGRIVYLDKDEKGLRYTNFNGRDINPIRDDEQIVDIVYPFRDQSKITRAFSIRYGVSYAALQTRVRETVTNIVIMALFGIAIALYIGSIIAGRITSPIQKLTRGAEAIGKGDLKTRIDVRSKSEIGKLAATFNQMAEHLEKNTQELVVKEKMTRELELAGEIQRELLPKEIPHVSNLDIAASLYSAQEVGGDCYDFLQVDKDRLLFYVSDVTGHGVPAGLVSAISNALVPALMDHCQNTRELINHLNMILKMKTRTNVFITMLMAMWHASKSQLVFTQAGHNPILHYRTSEGKVFELATGGMALGMIADIAGITTTETVDVAANDILVLYTDGITEAWKNETENYGTDRLKASILKNSKLKTAQQIHDAILHDVRDFMGDYPQQDDITLIVLKRRA
ncbi:hypothetical protein COY07_04320 [Candidatus Peregrinibacteria bacterium CG_4_10_14_0_2_um_filter_43_11]|nr:MAG: hypothetical protein COY07_04320 [Candidatus Peregrinibacteria bacterium CG_4_10_14_0_2_um_filter_43_11]